MESQLRNLGLHPLDHRDARGLIEIVHNEHLERSHVRLLYDAAKSGHNVLAFVVDGDDDREDRRLFAHMRPAEISSRIQGITSSSTSSSDVVASKPSTSRAFRTSDTRICSSCAYGGS